MPESTQSHHCGKCGAALSGYASDGLCAACLLESAFEPEEAGTGQPTRPTPLIGFRDYEILEEIARGGMGVIYRARQISLNRAVAIKMILGGHLANEAEMKRFRSEAETGARLRHPNIVAIYEVGEHAGQPFFSMDLVEGRNLAQLVRDEPLPSRKAAAYLQTIAEAVQFAHSNGVLHRDLKPSNILIDDHDQPRITDFGLAKRLGLNSELQSQELTLTGQVLGSPSFIPPEQAAGGKERIGPASDVYSLGAILYHCLTGRPPFLAETLTQTLRLVAEQEPVAPRLLNASVPRDLETICLKCLEKEPTRRYATAQELADELRRFLNKEPIRARPASVVLKVHRWCLRNRPLAVAGTAILALLLMVAIGSPIALFRINRARQQALANEKLAQKEASRSGAAFRFMSRMLEGVGPSVRGGRDPTLLREILDETAKRVHSDLLDQPQAEADLRIVLGKTYEDLGMSTNALAMTQEALRLRRLELGPTNAAVAEALNNLGAILYGVSDYAGAEKAAREALAIRTTVFGPIHTNVALSLNNLGMALWIQSKLEEAEQATQQALTIRKQLLPKDDPDIGMTLVNLGGIQWGRAKFAQVEQTFLEALPLFEKAGNMVAVCVLQANLGTVYTRRGDLEEAQAIQEKTLALRRKLFKGDHPHLGISLAQLALVLITRGDLEAAEADLKEAMAMQGRLSMTEHPDVADVHFGLGNLLARKGDWKGAEEEHQRALATRIKVLNGEANSDVVDSLDALGLLAIARHDTEQAGQRLTRAVQAARRSESPDYPAIIAPLWHLGWLLQQKADSAGYATNNAQALAIARKHGIYGTWPILKATYELADVLQLQGNFAAAEQVLRTSQSLAKDLAMSNNLQRELARRLAHFYEAWNRAAPSAENNRQAEEWKSRVQQLESTPTHKEPQA